MSSAMSQPIGRNAEAFAHFLVGRNRLRCGLLLFSSLLDPSLRVRLLLGNRNRRGCKNCNGRQDYLHG